MPPQTKMTKTERERYKQLQDLTVDTMLTFRWPELVQTILPQEWKDISSEPIPEKTRLTLRVDQDVAKFYRKLGPGYQATMNRVLRMFMIARLTEIVGVVQEPLETIVAKDTMEELALEHEAMLARQLDDMRKERLGIR